MFFLPLFSALVCCADSLYFTVFSFLFNLEKHLHFSLALEASLLMIPDLILHINRQISQLYQGASFRTDESF